MKSNAPPRLLLLASSGSALVLLALACSKSSSSLPASGEPAGQAGAPGGAAGQGGTGGAGGATPKAGASGASAGSPSAGSSGASGQGGKAGSAPYGIELIVGPDWIPYQPPGSPCTFHFMPKGGTPPSPVEWEPCEPKGLQGVACQQRTPTLPGIVGGDGGPVRWDPWANPPHMGIPRVRQTRWELVYWRPDGTFAGAIGYKGELPGKCHLTSGGRNTDSTYAFEHTDDLFASQSFVIAGRVGETPSFARGGLGNNPGEKDFGKTHYGTSHWVITHGNGQIHHFPWGHEDKSALLYSPSQHWSGLPGYPSFGYKDDYFIKVNSGGKAGWLSWTPETGVRDLLIQPVTYKRGFIGFNTDGQDIVFTYGEEATKSYLYSRLTLVRAAYSTDPAKIAQTAVAVANVPKHSPHQWAVGCGYAVMGAASEEEGVSLVVVRLSDGQLWRKWPTDPKDFGGIVPVAVTCQELFIQAGYQSRLQRIPLDSLGPGEPSPPQFSEWPF